MKDQLYNKNGKSDYSSSYESFTVVAMITIKNGNYDSSFRINRTIEARNIRVSTILDESHMTNQLKM
jgi:hypothetical protein